MQLVGNAQQPRNIVIPAAQNLWADTLTSTGRYTPLSAINDIAGKPVVQDGVVYASSHSGVTVASTPSNPDATEGPLSSRRSVTPSTNTPPSEFANAETSVDSLSTAR